MNYVNLKLKGFNLCTSATEFFSDLIMCIAATITHVKPLELYKL